MRLNDKYNGLESRSVNQPPLTPLLWKEGKKNSPLPKSRSGQVLTRTGNSPLITSPTLVWRGGVDSNPKDEKTGCVESPPSREAFATGADGGCDQYLLFISYESEELHPSPLRGTPLKGRGSDVRSVYQPPLSPLLWKEGRKNHVAVRTCPDAVVLNLAVNLNPDSHSTQKSLLKN